MCPLFNRMDLLYGERQNVFPAHVDDSTAPSQMNATGDDECEAATKLVTVSQKYILLFMIII
jgi:hypothetical protein